MKNRKKVIILYSDSGGGHKIPAQALKERLQLDYGWNVIMKNPTDLFLRSFDPFYRLTGFGIEQFYNKVALNHVWLIKPLLLILGLNFHNLYGSIVTYFERYWQEENPDMVVSLVHFMNTAIARSLQNISERTMFVTIPTDLDSSKEIQQIIKSDVWFSGYGHILHPTDHIRQQALEAGYSTNKLKPIGGVIIRPEFSKAHTYDRAFEHKKLGLDPYLPTGLVLMGGNGSREMLHIARIANGIDMNLQWIFLCGRNEKIIRQIGQMNTKYNKVVLGYNRDVSLYMSISDFYIGKPGTGSLSEALAMGLPCVYEYNSKTLPQERYNARWVESSGFGLLVNDFAELPHIIDQLLDGGIRKTIISEYRNTGLDDASRILHSLFT